MTPFAAALLMIVNTFPVFSRDIKTESPEDRQARLTSHAISIDRATLRATCQDEWATPDCKPLWRGDRADLALQLTMLNYQESGLSREVQAGQCKKHECDPQTNKDGKLVHLARTGWQLHYNGRLIAGEWDQMVGLSQEAMDHAAWAAAKIWVSSYWTCGGKVPGGIAAYAGQGTTCVWSGVDRRVRFYRMIKSKWPKAYREALAAQKPPVDPLAPLPLLATNP
jgi:hypothetical protein